MRSQCSEVRLLLEIAKEPKNAIVVTKLVEGIRQLSALLVPMDVFGFSFDVNLKQLAYEKI